MLHHTTLSTSYNSLPTPFCYTAGENTGLVSSCVPLLILFIAHNHHYYYVHPFILNGIHSTLYYLLTVFILHFINLLMLFIQHFFNLSPSPLKCMSASFCHNSLLKVAVCYQKIRITTVTFLASVNESLVMPKPSHSKNSLAKKCTHATSHLDQLASQTQANQPTNKGLLNEVW